MELVEFFFLLRWSFSTHLLLLERVRDRIKLNKWLQRYTEDPFYYETKDCLIDKNP